MNYRDYLQSPEWKALRKKAIDRDNGKCIFCNRAFREVHHVKYPKRFPQDHIDNLLVVCEKCHRRLHGIKNNDEELLETIHNRLEEAFHDSFDSEKESCGGIKNILESNEDRDLGYVALDMGATHDYPVEDCRKNNFAFMKNIFSDYLPNMNIDNFKLFCWKGSIGWYEDGDDMYNFICGNGEDNSRNHCFLCWESEKIIHWIIKNKWGKNA